MNEVMSPNTPTPDNAARATPVARYDMEVGNSNWRTYVDYSESADGEWVKYSAHAATVAALEAEVDDMRLEVCRHVGLRRDAEKRADAAKRRVAELEVAAFAARGRLNYLNSLTGEKIDADIIDKINAALTGARAK